MADSIESVDMNEPTERIDAKDMIDPIDSALPTDPMLSTLPTDPIDRTDPREPMLSRDDSEPIDNLDLTTSARLTVRRDTRPVSGTLTEDACSLLDDTVELRRELHATPEIGLDLPVTQSVLLRSLDGLDLELEEGRGLSSVVAVLRGSGPGPSTLLRADMDALPLHEDTGLGFASTRDGAMHACGHDAHVAMLVVAARLLCARRSELRGRVVFMFQPGEEGFAGARAMLEEGLVERHGPFDRAHALHITPVIPTGMVATRSGALMASSDAFALTITGRGGHASTPSDALDPVPVACEIVGALQTMITRTVPVFDPGVLTVASISAGTTTNVIPETAVVRGTIRAVSEQTRAIVLEGLTRVSRHVAAAHGCTSHIDPVAVSYPVTVNDDAAAARMLEVASELLGSDLCVSMPSPVMGAEDWSFVLQRLPGAMAFLGAQPSGEGPVAPNHSNRMVIDENAMATGVAMHAALALAS
jgi:amidohydrolase